jgi:hypothetical protein
MMKNVRNALRASARDVYDQMSLSSSLANSDPEDPGRREPGLRRGPGRAIPVSPPASDERGEKAPKQKIIVTQNWFEELKARVPTRWLIQKRYAEGGSKQ